MLPKILVKPAVEGTVVRKENGAILSKDGELVERNAFWLRRIKYNDVVEVKQKLSKPKEA